MANKRFYKLEIEKQALILNTALKEFMHMNFEAASINKISKKAGLSAGALYYYFDDKEDLFLTTIDDASKDIILAYDELILLFKENGFWQGIEIIIKRRLEFALEFPEKMAFIQRLILTKDHVERSSQNKILESFKMIFDYGYEHGYMKKHLPKELLFQVHLALIMSINKWGLDHIKSKEQIEGEKEMVKDYVEMIKNAIGVKVI